jgi:Protein of unknown function (DUF3592)
MSCSRKREGSGCRGSAATAPAPARMTLSIIAVLVIVYCVFELSIELSMRQLTRHWRPFRARVVDANLIEEDDDGVTYRVNLAYTYVIDGQTFHGTRLRFNEFFSPQQDSFELFHRSWIEELKSRMRAAQHIIVWVHPKHPHKAFVSREIRWELVAFYLVLIAGCVHALLTR